MAGDSQITEEQEEKEKIAELRRKYPGLRIVKSQIVKSQRKISIKSTNFPTRDYSKYIQKIREKPIEGQTL